MEQLTKVRVFSTGRSLKLIVHSSASHKAGRSLNPQIASLSSKKKVFLKKEEKKEKQKEKVKFFLV